MAKKIRLGLVFGGKSGEHEVSVRSARSIFTALSSSKYEVVLLGVDKAGLWHRIAEKWLLGGPEMKSLPFGDGGLVVEEEKIDVFFPIIHGSFGEDGCLQGLFELMDVAYVGAGVLGSAIGMDKDVQKRLLREAGIPTAKYKVLRIGNLDKKVRMRRFPVFVKPANMGSSVGVSRVERGTGMEKAIKMAFRYDTKILIEEAVVGREIEVAVLGNDRPRASLPGEVISRDGHDYYDYEAKYIDETGTDLKVPATNLSEAKVKEIQKIAVKAFKILECQGLARVDLFLHPRGQLVINEINTLPGFTSISMYPKLWEVSGLPYERLVDELVDLALEIKAGKARLKRSYR